MSDEESPTNEPHGTLHPTLPSDLPLQQVRIDILGPFPNSTANDRWIIVAIDHLTRYVETRAVHNGSASAMTIATCNHDSQCDHRLSFTEQGLVCKVK